jgi:hypothetical protein
VRGGAPLIWYKRVLKSVFKKMRLLQKENCVRLRNAISTLLAIPFLTVLLVSRAVPQTTKGPAPVKANQTAAASAVKPRPPAKPGQAASTPSQKTSPASAKKKGEIPAPAPITLTGEVMTGGIEGFFIRAQGSGEYYYLDLGKQGNTQTSKTKLPSGETQTATLMTSQGVDSYMTLYYPNEIVSVRGTLKGTVTIEDKDVGPVVLMGLQMSGGAEEFRPVVSEEGRRFKRIKVQSIDKVK